MIHKVYRSLVRFGVLFLLIILRFSLFADGTYDSLQRVWSDEASSDSIRFGAFRAFYPKYIYSYPDSSLAYTKYHFALAKRSGNRAEMSTAYNEMGIAYYILGLNDSAVSTIQRGVDIRLELGDTLIAAKFRTNLASVYRANGDYLKAFRMKNESLKVYKANKDTLMEALLLSDLGIICYDVSKYELALDYLNQSIALYRTKDKFKNLPQLLYKLGAVSFEMKEYDKTLDYADRGLKEYGADSICFGYAYCYTLKASVYNKTEKIDSGLKYINKSLRINKQIGNKDRIIICNLELAELLFHKDLDSSMNLAKTLLEQLDGAKKYDLKSRLYNLLHKGYKQQGIFSKSLDMHELYALYSDSVALEANDIALVKELVQKDFDKILEESKEKASNDKSKLQIEQKKRIVGIVLAGLLLIGGLFLYARKRMKQKDVELRALLDEINDLKAVNNSESLSAPAGSFQLDRVKIEDSIGKKLNETDWNILKILVDDPVISNKDIADKSFLSVEGISSALRRMYVTFDVKESRYKKVSLLMEVIKLSNTR